MRRRSGSLASLREDNRGRVIDALRERGVASRAELARITGLSRSTISTIVGDLSKRASRASATVIPEANRMPAGRR